MLTPNELSDFYHIFNPFEFLLYLLFPLLIGSKMFLHIFASSQNLKICNRIQRLIAISVINAYRTTSGAAALVIAGMLLLDLVAKDQDAVRS